jgi:carboxyl-terminal processing protease
MTKPELLESLRSDSAKRVAESSEFAKYMEKIKAYVEQKNNKSVSLNKDKYMARREKFNADEEDEKTMEDQINHSSLEIKRDYYINEVLQIAVDYVQDLQGKKVANN